MAPPSRFVNFFSRVEYLYEDQPIKVILTFANTPAPEDKFAFLLDIDLIWENAAHPLQLEKAIDTVDDLRKRERDMFELLITDQTRELFNGT